MTTPNPEQERTQTPETDKFANEAALDQTLSGICKEWADFARSLETRLTAALDEGERVSKDLAHKKAALVDAMSRLPQIATAEKRTEQAEQSAAQLREDLKAARADAKEGWDAFYLLRHTIGEDKYPGLTNIVRTLDAPADAKEKGEGEER